MQIRRILGWLLIVPLAVNVIAELYVVALILFQGSNNDERYLALTFGAFPLLVTGPLAYVGWRLIQRSVRGRDTDQSIPAEAVTEPHSATRISGWALVVISIAVMAMALLVVVSDVTNLARFIKVSATIGIWILFALPLAAGIKRIRSGQPTQAKTPPL